MTPQHALTRAKSYLDEATENLTFDAHHWSFEEACRAAAWIANALADPPRPSLDLAPKGHLPTPDALRAALAPTMDPPTEISALADLITLRKSIGDPDDPEAALATRSDDVDQLVFATWDLYDAARDHLGLADDDTGDEHVFAEILPWQPDGPTTFDRRQALKLFGAAGLLPLHACKDDDPDLQPPNPSTPSPSSPSPSSPKSSVRSVDPLAPMHWETTDPFLFCAHHHDQYPDGDDQLGPDASLQDRHLGRDFDTDRDWRMYHGRQIPGFPRHPHRGFETVTVVRTGRLDHSDSLGATARYGAGDVQWLTAGKGIQHAEMFPLLKPDAPNPLELFQIWLNLPASDKMVDPHFTMLWNGSIPRAVERDDAGRITELKLAAGRFADQRPPAPPPNSWAARDDSDVAIWTIRMEPGARFELPAVSPDTERNLYIHRGAGLRVGATDVPNRRRATLDGPDPVPLEAGPKPTELLLLQGRPIDEPVAKRGPFVMNSQQEIRQAYADYRQTQFGGWPWHGDDPVHPRHKGRFARHIDGTFEEPT